MSADFAASAAGPRQSAAGHGAAQGGYVLAICSDLVSHCLYGALFPMTLLGGKPKKTTTE
jgi:hypothetical protein